MKKKFLLIIVSILTLFSAFALSFNAKASATEKTEQEMVQEELNNIVLPEEVIFDFPVVYVSVYGSTIKWESNKPEVINVPTNGGWAKVNRQAQDEEVILTVTLTKGTYSKSKDFEITVPKGQTLTSEYKLEFELNDGTLENAPKKYVVGSNLKLPIPTKGEVEFLGWYDNANFEGDSIESIPTGTFGDVKYYAKWAEAQIKEIQVVEYQKEYNAKQEFDKSSLKVVAVYNDNLTKEEISLDDLIVDKTILHYGDTKVVVSYGNYTAEVEVVVSQLEYELDFELEETYETTYNGKEQQLDLSSVQLPKGLNFVMESYKEANEAGYEVEVSLKNTDPDYKDVTTTYTTKFIIKKAELTVKFVCNDTFKAGQEIDLNNYVLYSGFVQGESKDVLTGTLDFDITPDGYPAAGIYTVTPKGLTSNNYKINYVSGQLELTISSYQFKVENTETTYNGKNQMFTAKLLGDGQELNVEFTYTVKDTEEAFSGAINAGTYTVVVSYELEGETKEHEVTFIINAKKLEASMFDAIPEQNYTGQKVEPTVTSKDLELNKDFEILGYDNNIDKTTADNLARVTIKGLGNFTGEVDLYFAIGETALEEVRDAKEELDKEYGSSSALPEEDLVTETQNGSKVQWFSTSTALSIDKDGKVTTIQTDQEQVVVVYALIINGDSADYAMYEFTIPAKSQTPDTYTVTLGFEAEQGEVKASKVSQITAGEKVTLTITPKEGYRVSSITVNGVSVSKDQREFTINENTTIQVSFEQYIYEDETTGIVTEGETSKLTVTEEDTNEYTVSANQQTLAAYDINFEGHDGQTGVTVKIPVPTGYENEDLVVYHLENGEYVDMEAEKVDGYLVFTTSSFSPYIVTTKPVQGGEEQGQDVTVTVKISEYATANSWSDAQQYLEVELDSNIKAIASSDGNNGKYYNSGTNWRMYQTNDGTVTITSTAGVIKSVKITYTSSNTGTLVFNESNVASDEVVEVNANSALFSVGNTGSATNGQARITAIEVTYVSSEGGSDTSCEHTTVVTDEAVEATCTTAGKTKGSHCSDCGAVLEAQQTVAATGHSYTEWEEVTAPTCTATGLKQRGCENCDHTETETVATTDHNFVDGVCDDCGATEDDVAKPVEATITFDDTSKRTEYSTSKQVWTENSITVTNNKASSTTNVADYAKPARFYANSELIVAAPGSITKIEFDCNSSSYATTLKNSIGTVSGATVEVSSDKVTVTFETPVDSFTIAKLTGQVRMDGLTVTYTPSN